MSYDGALDPLGGSQVLPYVRGLSARGHRFDLVTFEKPERWEREGAAAGLQESLAANGIRWHPLEYHRRPSALATAYDLRVGLQKARALHASEPFDLVHVRSYPCAIIALSLNRSFGIPYVFDMRGLYPEERVDGGLWSEAGPLFAIAKRLERDFLREAAAVVTLTRASTLHVQSLMDSVGSAASLSVIPTAVDIDRFKPTARSDVRRFVYLGSIGTWYRVDAMVELTRAWLELDERIVVEFLINGSADALTDRLEGLDRSRVVIRSVAHAEVPGALAGALATFAVIDPAPSKIASAPTKIGESLAAGLPVLVNRGVGDAADWVDQAGVGVVVESLDPIGYQSGAAALLHKATEAGIAERCRAFAEEHLSLQHAIDLYDGLYASVAATRTP